MVGQASASTDWERETLGSSRAIRTQPSIGFPGSHQAPRCCFTALSHLRPFNGRCRGLNPVSQASTRPLIHGSQPVGLARFLCNRLTCHNAPRSTWEGSVEKPHPFHWCRGKRASCRTAPPTPPRLESKRGAREEGKSKPDQTRGCDGKRETLASGEHRVTQASGIQFQTNKFWKSICFLSFKFVAEHLEPL